MNSNPAIKTQLLTAILTGALLLMPAVCVVAQDVKKPLDNSDVVEMTKAGLPESTIILAIQKGPSQFDTSPQALIQLKSQGVSATVLDAMIRAGSPPASPVQTTGPVRRTNPLDPLSPTTVVVPATTGVTFVDGETRLSMKYSSPEMRTNSMLGAVVNPFHKSRIRTALNGNHAQLRTKNTSPLFEVGIVADANPADLVAIVKLQPKSDTREIETGRGSITGVSSGFRKEDILPISIEEIPGLATQSQKVYRVKLINPLRPGEYALVHGSAAYYDFGVDGN